MRALQILLPNLLSLAVLAQEPQRLETVVVEGRGDSLLGVADSATEGVVDQRQLRRRPLQRTGGVLENVPGLVVTQHSGSGKANQFFLRGFNLDHGTDLRTSIAGMPVNQPSHGHGQGYTDLEFLIPELIETVTYRKGPYRAMDGDFAAAGTVELDYVTRLDAGLARFELGSFGHARSVLADSFELGPDRTLLVAVETRHDDGPFVVREDADQRKVVLRYAEGDGSAGFSVTAMGYEARWDATDQIPRRAVAQGLVSRFGTLDDTDGGASSRFSLNAEWHHDAGDGATSIGGYAIHQDLDLFSNFTFLLDDEVHGDQFEQTDRRTVFGLDARRSFAGTFDGSATTSTVGVQLRSDLIENGLHRTERRQRRATTRRDQIAETSLALWAENRTWWTSWLRTTAGLRGDLFLFDVDSDLAANGGSAHDTIASPKLALVLGPWAATELYLNGGLGFHSNDARGVTLRDDPTTATPDDGVPVPALVRSEGAELGLRTKVLPGLQSSLAFWLLQLDSELVFVGDAGGTEASRPSRRAGIEWTSTWEPLADLTFDADLSFSQARFRDHAPEGDRIPGAIETSIQAGVAYRLAGRVDLGLRLRHFGARSLVEDDRVRSRASTLVSANAGCRITDETRIDLEVFNLFDREASDIEYSYVSRLRGEPGGGVDDVHFHPVEPLAVRVAFTVRF